MNTAEEFVRMWLQVGANWHFERVAELGKAMVRTLPEEWTPTEERLIARFERDARPEAKQCFANAQKAVLMRIGVQYWEGYAARHDIQFPLHHAWITINGKVYETCPWGRETGADYFGIEVSEELVRRSVFDSLHYGSMLCDDYNGFKAAREILGEYEAENHAETLDQLTEGTES